MLVGVGIGAAIHGWDPAGFFAGVANPNIIAGAPHLGDGWTDDRCVRIAGATSSPEQPDPARGRPTGRRWAAVLAAGMVVFGAGGYALGASVGGSSPATAPTAAPAEPDELAMVDEYCDPLAELAVELRSLGDGSEADATEVLGQLRAAVDPAQQVHVDILIETYEAVAVGDVTALADDASAARATAAADAVLTHLDSTCGIDLAAGA